MHVQQISANQMKLIRLDPGEDILESLEEVVRAHHITNAVIVSGVGSVDRYYAHVVETPKLPPGNIYFGEEKALDILAITGMVLEGRVHAHITLSDPEHAMGGHLERGCRVLTFAVVAMIETPEGNFQNWDTVGPLVG